jgi:LacI family transcriptional regulator
MPVAQVRDVAALAGVSPATVSNALNHPAKVSPSTLARIQAAIDELGYIRNDAARQLRAGTNRAIGMIVLDIANPFFTDVARGVEDVLLDEQRPLILGNSAQQDRRETNYLDLFEQQRMNGVLITPVGDVLDRLRRLRDRGTSVVLVDRMTEATEFSSVAIDDTMGGRIATETHGSGEVTFLETDSMNAEAGRQGAEELLALPADRRPDAIFAGNDLVALGVLQALTLAGVRVPDDIAIIGYDDIDFASSAAIPLSSVRQPADVMGRTAARLLLDVIADPEASEVQHVTLEPQLVVRRSTSG